MATQLKAVYITSYFAEVKKSIDLVCHLFTSKRKNGMLLTNILVKLRNEIMTKYIRDDEFMQELHELSINTCPVHRYTMTSGVHRISFLGYKFN